MDDFKEEFKKLAEEKGMTYPELAKIVIDMFTDEDGCMSFGGYVVDKCTLNEALSAKDFNPLKRRANTFYGKEVFKE
jgi:hypothetical protein